MAAAIVGLVAVLVLAGVLWWQSRSGLLATRRARRVVLTLKTGEAFTGVLFASDRECVVLREAEAVAFGRDGSNVVVEGEALILRSDIAYLQLP